jgi:catechol 2,3-dioxygenase-like lactoylglutathione lyase family enzyme
MWAMEKPLPVLGFRHIALNVRDVRKSLEFYSNVFGMTLEWMPDPENAYLTSGGDNLALHQLPPEEQPGNVQTVHHIGFVVRRLEDVDEWAKKVRGLGISLAAEPKTHRDGARSFYFHDPDGILIQLIYHPPLADK